MVMRGGSSSGVVVAEAVGSGVVGVVVAGASVVSDVVSAGASVLDGVVSSVASVVEGADVSAELPSLDEQPPTASTALATPMDHNF
jgi:hypothetical protein